MAKINLETTNLNIYPYLETYKHSNKFSKKYCELVLDVDDNEQSIFESINKVIKEFIEPSPSNMKQKTAMKRK